MEGSLILQVYILDRKHKTGDDDLSIMSLLPGDSIENHLKYDEMALFSIDIFDEYTGSNLPAQKVFELIEETYGTTKAERFIVECVKYGANTASKLHEDSPETLYQIGGLVIDNDWYNQQEGEPVWEEFETALGYAKHIFGTKAVEKMCHSLISIGFTSFIEYFQACDAYSNSVNGVSMKITFFLLKKLQLFSVHSQINTNTKDNIQYWIEQGYKFIAGTERDLCEQKEIQTSLYHLFQKFGDQQVFNFLNRLFYEGVVFSSNYYEPIILYGEYYVEGYRFTFDREDDAEVNAYLHELCNNNPAYFHKYFMEIGSSAALEAGYDQVVRCTRNGQICYYAIFIVQ